MAIKKTKSDNVEINAFKRGIDTASLSEMSTAIAHAAAAAVTDRSGGAA